MLGSSFAKSWIGMGSWLKMPRKPCTHNRKDVKQAIQLMEDMGKTVTAVKYHPDGTFRVMTSEHTSKLASDLSPEASLDAWIGQKKDAHTS